MALRHCSKLLALWEVRLSSATSVSRIFCHQTQRFWSRHFRPSTRVVKLGSVSAVCFGFEFIFKKSNFSSELSLTRLVALCSPGIGTGCTSDDNPPAELSQKCQDGILVLWIGKLYAAVVLVLRSISLFMRFFPILCLYPVTIIIPRSQPLWWWALLVAMETAGPSFIKLGQWASTRRDLFSEEFCDRFSIFHHKITVHQWQHSEMQLLQAFGSDWRSLFTCFNEDEEPIGSGCVAQVYKAYFKPSKICPQLRKKLLKEGHLTESSLEEAEFGIPVAVKVSHPNITEKVYRDLRIMKFMTACLTVCLPSLHWLSLNECMLEFEILMEKQLDLVSEARCLDKFAENFSSSKHIIVPRPIWPYVTRDVLIETFEVGVHISTFIKDKNCPHPLKKTLAQLGVGALLKMIFVDNFIHGDLHPGNILVQNADRFVQKLSRPKGVQNTEDSDVKLVLLDVGITASMKQSDLYKFVEVFKAVVRGKGGQVADLFLTQSRISECRNPAAFKEEMTKLVKLARQEAASLGKVTVGTLLSQVFGLMIEHHIKVESNFASVILAIAVLEGLGRSLDPELNILKSAKPFLLPHTWKK